MEIKNAKCFVRVDDVNNLITGKLALKYAGTDIESMKAIAAACKNRSLAEFQKVNIFYFKIFWYLMTNLLINVTKNLEHFKAELIDDNFVRSHLDVLYDNLLEQNLSRIIEPFSKVQIEHIAHLIKLPKVGLLF